MNLDFGKAVIKEALELTKKGKDANQVAGILAKKDPKSHNYGIGIVLDGAGRPLESSTTLMRYAAQELQHSHVGTYLNSASQMEKLKIAVLQWQRIPVKYWNSFNLDIPSDAGTGAVQTAIDLALFLNPNISSLLIEKWGWPAYKALARVARLKCEEQESDQLSPKKNDLVIYQAGPMNTTGQVQNKETIEERAKQAGQKKSSIILDRAYPGFEFARDLSDQTYDDVMKKSFALQIEPFIKQEVPFSLALSPTKAFVTFSLRPCGFLLVYSPRKAQQSKVSSALNTIIRARGSSFEHPISRAFVKAMVNDQGELEKEHEKALQRIAEAEALWQKLSEGTSIEYLFTKNYAGLFRNPKASKEADLYIYNEHMYPVFSQNRCRQNVTGLPNSEELAKHHVHVFAKYCH